MRGENAYRKGDYGAARADFAKAVQLEPHYAEAHNALGVVYGTLNQYQASIQEFEQAVALLPEYSVPLGNLAVLYCARQQFEDAEHVAIRAIRICPDDRKCLLIVAICELNRDQSTDAVQNLERAADQYPPGRLLAAKALIRMGMRDRAAAQLEQFLYAAPSDDEIRRAAEADLAALREK